MGSFSWTRAENTTHRSNLTYGDKYKILVPEEFGGGFIKDIYYDYGYVFKNNESYGGYFTANGDWYSPSFFGECDLYGILAWWNGCHDLLFEGNKKPETMEEILKYGCTCYDKNRASGINIGCYDSQIDSLKYPLKLVSVSYKKTYEECKGNSYCDPNQGFGKYYWYNNDYNKYLKEIN